MNLCDECETASLCLKKGCIPLTACINSGQVSAAQVVAHAENGEAALQKLTEIGEATGWPEGMLQDDSRQLKAGELPSMPKPIRSELGIPLFSKPQMLFFAMAARNEAMQELAAARERVLVLRETLTSIATADIRKWEQGYQTTDEFMAWAQSRARAALAATQQGAIK